MARKSFESGHRKLHAKTGLASDVKGDHRGIHEGFTYPVAVTAQDVDKTIFFLFSITLREAGQTKLLSAGHDTHGRSSVISSLLRRSISSFTFAS